MGTRVVEGRTSAAPGDNGTGTDRRAFGEFIGPQGELASYAFGWCTCGEHDSAFITVGIGVGKPGGGTFHAAIVDTGEGYGCGLVAEPFEDVPQGGPHLTITEARAHEDLSFIWFVVDTVLERDHRADWMRHWLLGTACTVSTQVVDGSEPVIAVACDADGAWTLTGRTPSGSDGVPAHLHHVVDDDPTLAGILGLAPGESAIRDDVSSPWRHQRVTPDRAARFGRRRRRR